MTAARVEVSYSIRQVSVILAPSARVGGGVAGMIAVAMDRLFEAKGNSVSMRPRESVDSSVSTEERIAMKMGSAMIHTMAGQLEPKLSVLYLTWEEYEKLGKPTVNDVLTATLEKKGDRIDADAEE